MFLNDLISRGGTYVGMHPNGKKQLLSLLCDRAAEKTGLDSRSLLEAVMEREQLGSTGVGGGVAIPHARCAELDEFCGFFARLEEPVEFDAIDDAPVDLVFLLLGPAQDGAGHLRALARISRVLRRPETRDKLRRAPDESALNALLSDLTQTRAA